VTAKSINSR